VKAALRPSKAEKRVICDDLSAHDTDDVWDWLLDHPRWTLHFTPEHAPWLNRSSAHSRS
jgi:transposase